MSSYSSSGASGHSRSSKASAPGASTAPRDSMASRVSIASTITDVSTTSSWVDVDYPTASDVAAPAPPDRPARDPAKKTWLGRLTSKEPKRLSMNYADDDGHDMTKKLLDRLTIVSEVTNIDYEGLQTPTDARPTESISDIGVQRRSVVSNLELPASGATTPTRSGRTSLHTPSAGTDDLRRHSATPSASSYVDSVEAPPERQRAATVRSARESTASSASTASSRSFASSGSRVSTVSTAPTSRPSSVASSVKTSTYTGASAHLADKATATPGQGTLVVNLKDVDNSSVASYEAPSVSERRRSSATANASATDAPSARGSVASAAAVRSRQSQFASPVHSATGHGNAASQDAAPSSEFDIKPASPAFVTPQSDVPADMPRQSAPRHHSSDRKAPAISARTKETPRPAPTLVQSHPAELTNATTPSWCKTLGTPKPIQVVNVTEVYPAGQAIIRPSKQPSTSARESSSSSSARLADLSNHLSNVRPEARQPRSPVSPSRHTPGRTYPISKDQCATITLSGPLGACRSLQAGYEELDQPTLVSIAVEPYSARKHVMNKDDIVWLICWDVGTCGTGRRVLRVRCEDNTPVYFGPRTHDAHDPLPFVEGGRQVYIADMDTYPVGTLDLTQRRRLEEVAGHVGDVDGFTSFEWICRVLKTAYRPPKGRAILDRDAVMAALNSISNSIHGDL